MNRLYSLSLLNSWIEITLLAAAHCRYGVQNVIIKTELCIWICFVSCKTSHFKWVSSLNGDIKAYHNTLCYSICVSGESIHYSYPIYVYNVLYYFVFWTSKRLWWSTSDNQQLLFHGYMRFYEPSLIDLLRFFNVHVATEITINGNLCFIK